MSGKRISIRIRDPNPLFRTWIAEWANQADIKGQDKLGNSFRRALNSLEKYPLPMARARDCMILEGFGKTICDMLDKRLIKYRAFQSTSTTALLQSQENIDPPPPPVKPKKPIQSKLATATVSQSQHLLQLPLPSTSATSKKMRKTKSEQSLLPNVPSPIKTNNNLPPTLASTLTLAKAGTKRKATTTTTVDSAASATPAASAVATEDVIMLPGTFDIILLVDSMETVGKNKRHMDTTLIELNKLKVRYEVRHLNIGDFTWIARDKRHSSRELILPYIVERKRLDDLAGSIKSGRYQEQKFRLRSSGIPNVTYLIEYLAVKNYGLPIQTLYKAVVNSEVHSDCQVKYTDSAKETILYLAVHTTLLEELFGQKMLCGCAKEDLPVQSNRGPEDLLNLDTVSLMQFEEFNQSASKWGAVQIKDFFVRQLIQLFQMSVEKAMGIVAVYPTPRALLTAYEDPLIKKDVAAGRALLSKITYGPTKRTIGPSLSKIIFDLYHTETPG